MLQQCEPQWPMVWRKCPITPEGHQLLEEEVAAKWRNKTINTFPIYSTNPERGGGGLYSQESLALYIFTWLIEEEKRADTAQTMSFSES